MSKVYDVGIQRYRDQKIRVSGKDSIPFSSICISIPSFPYLNKFFEEFNKLKANYCIILKHKFKFCRFRLINLNTFSLLTQGSEQILLKHCFRILNCHFYLNFLPSICNAPAISRLFSVIKIVSNYEIYSRSDFLCCLSQDPAIIHTKVLTSA